MKFNADSSNNMDILNGIIKKNKTELQSETVVNLPMNMIDPDPDNQKYFSMDNIEALSEAINDVGFTGAIEVFRKEDGRYQIIAGERRWRANKLSGKDTIRAIVSSKVDKVAFARRFIGSNVLARDLSPWEYANIVKFYKENLYEIDRKEEEAKRKKGEKIRFRDVASKKLGLSPTSVYRYECISRTIPELQEYAKEKTFPYDVYTKICTLPEKQQLLLADRLKEFISFKEAFNNDGENEVVTINASRINSMIEDIVRREENKEREEQKKKVIDKLADVKNEDKIVLEKEDAPKEIVITVGEKNSEIEEDDYFADNEIELYISRIEKTLTSNVKIKNKKKIKESLENILFLLQK